MAISIADIKKVIEEKLNALLVQQNEANSTEYKPTISTERAFIDVVKEQQENPEDMTQKDTIFFVLKFGKGSWNFAVANLPVTIEVLSEANTMDGAQQLLRDFAASVNYRWEELNSQTGEGIIQTYYEPEVTNALSEVYEGFRSLMVMSGNVRIPTAGAVLVTNVFFSTTNSAGAWTDESEIPFITLDFSHTAQPDPQAFPQVVTVNGEKILDTTSGYTTALNKQTTDTLSITTYLFNYGSSSSDPFSLYIMDTIKNNNMNRKFRLRLRTNVKDGANGYLDMCDEYFVLANNHYNQDWGNTAPIILSFTRAKKEEI